MPVTTLAHAENDLTLVELTDLEVTRFVEDSSVVGAPTSFEARPTVRPIRRTSPGVKHTA
ncbi:hypothetical protein V5P93_005018 [Actinokineospora auranticolor]|uniref:Uncharacterized protein n=1 Tax=Actinokineospora auranticolor TaxID=155976 RepID=A0A2S6GK65_9PSEU|nr:hypothetical protein [Actinokineospora auranticolor]PPK65546.1 hypothetical protein CLV40_11330 [Actinokineospora auranticolor]